MIGNRYPHTGLNVTISLTQSHTLPFTGRSARTGRMTQLDAYLRAPQFMPFGSPGVATCTTEPVPTGPTDSHLTDLTVPPGVTKRSRSCENSDAPPGPLGNVVQRCTRGQFLSAPCLDPPKTTVTAILSVWPGLTVAKHKPYARDWLARLFTQETQTAFWPEVESGREALWEVVWRSGTSVGRWTRRDGSALPAHGLGLSVGHLHPSSQKPRAGCAFERFRQVTLPRPRSGA